MSRIGTVFRNSLRLRAIAPGVCAALVLIACHSAPPPELPPNVAALMQERKWDEALSLINQHLLVSPRDVAAHFYRGQCYASLKDPALAVAEGEFRIALSLFRQAGVTAKVAGMAPKDFELRCCLEIANVYMQSLNTAVRLNASEPVLEQLVRKVESITAEAARIAPDEPRVKRLEDFLVHVMQHRQPGPPSTPQERVAT